MAEASKAARASPHASSKGRRALAEVSRALAPCARRTSLDDEFAVRRGEGRTVVVFSMGRKPRSVREHGATTVARPKQLTGFTPWCFCVMEGCSSLGSAVPMIQRVLRVIAHPPQNKFGPHSHRAKMCGGVAKVPTLSQNPGPIALAARWLNSDGPVPKFAWVPYYG